MGPVSGRLHTAFVSGRLVWEERSCARALVRGRCATVCVCVTRDSTHLQHAVLWEVCAVDGVPHFVSAVESAQRAWTEQA